jgi:hypothetical protein
MRFWQHVLAVTLLPALCVSCPPPKTGVANAEAIAAILWVPPDALLRPDEASPVLVRNGRSIYVDGTGGVGFARSGDRETLTSEIVQHFADAGWRQRRTQDINPQFATSFESGWQGQCACVIQLEPQGHPIPRERFYQWHGEWENVAGDILTYALFAEGQQLSGRAWFVPVSLIDERKPRPSK